MRLLILGSNGQLGRDLMAQARIRGWQAVGADLPHCDITENESIQATFAAAEPVEGVINAAAYTAVDAAESHPEPAFAVNRDGIGLVAQQCLKRQLPLIHVSTDYVFDGLKTTPYLPSDPMAPRSVYGRSKAEGEMALRRQWYRHVIVRTSWLFGHHGGNFVKTMLRLGKEKHTLRVVDDQVGCPTYAGDLAAALLDVAGQANRQPERWGTYHFCNKEPASWYTFAQAIIDMARSYEPMAATHIEPIRTSDYPVPAPRPPYSVLDCGTLESCFGIVRRPWATALGELLALLYQKL